MVIACHQIGHVGSATVVRRASGKKLNFFPSDEQRAF
jgi:hypothetical protein